LATELGEAGRNDQVLREVHFIHPFDADLKANRYSDVTDKAAVQALHNEVCTNFPPTAGVAHGAMLLKDTAIFDMTIETMNTVLRPKVEGARNLDEIFSQDTLDFFVMFSSLASVFGNHGQSNYTAANLYLNSLAKQRRQRGLVGSVIAVGAIMGIGYMAREVSQSALDQISKAGFLWMSERDLHQVFAEGVLAGRDASGPNPEIITGLRVVNRPEDIIMPWVTNPMFQHCVLLRDRPDTKQDGSDSSVPAKTQLLTATTKIEVFGILQGESFEAPALDIVA
jgi:hybrid polyketide synthase / nonribosomal peptide synthetase ACE1